MRRKLTAILSALVMISLSATAAFAGRTHLSGFVAFQLGSLIASGTFVGLGKQDVAVILDATGNPVVTCTNQGGNQAPGQNPPKVLVTGITSLPGNHPLRKNGISPFQVKAKDPQPLSAIEFGCPNDNWTAAIEFVFWTDAIITVREDLDPGADIILGDILFGPQSFTCTTTRDPAGVTCTPTP